MNDIKQSIKDSIKAHQAELTKLEKALAALEGTKPAPKAKATTSSEKRSTETSSPTSTRQADGGHPLPDRILSLLAPSDSGTMVYPHGLQAADIAKQLSADLGQVRTTCSRLVRENKLGTHKEGRSVSYLGLKSEAAPSPFVETN